MPIYEYKCSHCGHIFEAFQRMGDDGANLMCPLCAKTNPQKIFSTVAASTKGSLSGSSFGASGCSRGGFT